jgi:hypothetical protein
MSGGLSHHTDEENGPSHTVGHELSKQQGCYSLERNQCVCADVIRVPANYKNKPTPLDMTDVVRDVEKLQVSENQVKCEERTFLPEPRKSLLGHPDAIEFLRISGKRAFQHPRE